MRAPTARPGEFYQLDFEMSFVTQDDVFAAIEPVLAGVFEEFADWQGKGRTVAGCRSRASRTARRCCKYGTDKPDLRNPILISDVSEHFQRLGLRPASPRSSRAAAWSARSRRPAPPSKSRKFFDDMNDWAQREGFAGLGYVDAARAASWAARSPRTMARRGCASWSPTRSASGPDDGLFFAAGKEAQAAKLAGARPHPGRRAARPDRREALRILLDRRFPDVRI